MLKTTVDLNLWDNSMLFCFPSKRDKIHHCNTLLSQMGKLIKQAWDLQELGECRGFRDGYYCIISLVEIKLSRLGFRAPWIILYSVV